MNRLFGTDGIRGKANKYPITPEVALRLGKGVAHLFRQADRRNRIIIGKDTRLSGYILEHALVSGICSMGLNAILAGVMTTSGVAYLTQIMRADAGVMISASHNPFDDNGIKIFEHNGFKLSNDQELEIEKFMVKDIDNELKYPNSENLGKAIKLDNAKGMYIAFLKNHFPKKYDLKGMKIGLDCANGSSFKIAPDIFSDLGAEVDSLFIDPNGININEKCGSLYPNTLRDQLIEKDYNVGFAFDGDADRVIAIDDKGNIVNGDQIICICAKYLKDRNLLPNNSIVTTIMANSGLISTLNDLGIKVITTNVGDKNVLDKMIETNVILGGESSGHIIFLENHNTGDGILTAIKLLSIMIEEDKPLSELSRIMTIYPSKLINIEVEKKIDLSTFQEVKEVVNHIEGQLKRKGRILIRYSETQPLCRVLVEAPNFEMATKFCEEIVEVIKKNI